MKYIFLTLILIGFAAQANDSETQAGWFSPSCPNCAKYLTPGSASLGNTKGVYHPDKKKKKKDSAPAVKADTGQ